MRRSSLERTRRWAAILGVAWCGALVCSASEVRAEQRAGAKRYELRWVREGGAEGCVSGAALERLLDRILAAGPPLEAEPVSIEGTARTAAPPLRYAVSVAVRDSKSGEMLGERELTTSDPKCAALTPALLLVLAMSIDPNAGRDGLPQAVSDELQRGRDEDVDVWPPHPTPTAPLTAEPPPPAKRQVAHGAATPHPPPPSEDGARVLGAVALSAGVLPAVAVGAELGARIPLRRGWSLSLSGLGFLPQVVELEPSPYLQDRGVQIAAGQLGAALCRPLLGARLELAVCGGVAVGLRWVSALALASRNNPTRAFYGPTLGLESSFRPASSWFVSAGTTLQTAPRTDHFSYVNHAHETRVWYDPPLLSGRAWLAVGAVL